MSKVLSLLLVAAVVASCGRINSAGSSAGLFKRDRAAQAKVEKPRDKDGRIIQQGASADIPRTPKEQLQGGLAAGGLDLNALFRPPNDDKDIRVNKHLWTATLETLNFLPIEAADPFSGVIVLGWGRAPGSNTQFRATVLIQDPALEASSLKVAMQKRNGPASVETNKRIEDAILTRARQLRIAATKR
ncbi:DUF3576 domain-containing protein [Amylibacter sp. SFDW26]|nr:DUF3576 domain-containing protein [Amylibacter sp. SFDW26]